MVDLPYCTHVSLLWLAHLYTLHNHFLNMYTQSWGYKIAHLHNTCSIYTIPCLEYQHWEINKKHLDWGPCLVCVQGYEFYPLPVFLLT